MANTGNKGTYKGMPVTVTKVHEDGALDVQKTWSDGSAENLPWFERIAAEEFLPEFGAEKGQVAATAPYDEIPPAEV